MGLFGNSKKKQQEAVEKANAQFAAQRDFQIMNDCLNIIQSTTNKDTFYYRLQLFEDTLLHLKTLESKVSFSGATPSQIIAAFERDKPGLIQAFEARGGEYFDTMEKIDAQWAVLSNLKLFTGDKADSFERLCYLNIQQYHNMVRYNEQISPEHTRPPHVPAYVRLAMLYEKQGKYDRAIEVCAAAIKAGAVNDGSKGKMYGRLARMVRKAGIEITPEIQSLMIEH